MLLFNKNVWDGAFNYYFNNMCLKPNKVEITRHLVIDNGNYPISMICADETVNGHLDPRPTSTHDPNGTTGVTVGNYLCRSVNANHGGSGGGGGSIFYRHSRDNGILPPHRCVATSMDVDEYRT